MKHNRTLGLALIIIGVVANNYAFFHDLLWQDYGAIIMGWRTWLLALAGIATTLIGLAMIVRGRPPTA
ncbi:MAG: hypothetical protein RII27_05695 [Alphaproteobacteria bacterium]